MQLFARTSRSRSEGVAEARGLGVEGGGEELSEGSLLEQGVVSGVYWVSAVACIVVGSESRSAVECRASCRGAGAFISGGWSHPAPMGGEKPEMQEPSNQTRDSGENREMVQSCVETRAAKDSSA
jgi:hypothetical protein